MAKRTNNPSWAAAAEVLSTLVPQFTNSTRWREYRVWEVWEDVVGEAIARKARPSKIHNGKLFVIISNSAFMQELQFSKAIIRERLNQQLGAGTIKDLLFVIGRVKDVAMRPTPPRQRPLPPFTDIQLPSLEQQELKAAFAKLLAARRRRLLRKGSSRD
jgi:hypothetical protein